MTVPCDDLRIIDLSEGPVGGVATMVLADFGADVIKVERPGGDPFRRLAAAPMWLRGKRSIELDLTTDEGRAHLRRLADTADVVVSSAPPGAAAPLGADYDTLREGHPALVYCSITGWGPTGPLAGYPGYEALIAAKCGRMKHFEGVTPRKGPVYSAVQTASHAASQSAVAGILAALLIRDTTGEGDLVETSLLQAMLPFDLRILLWRQLAERYPDRFANNPFSAPPPAPTLQYQPVLTKDGRWIQLANLLEHHFATYIGVSDLGDIWAEERFLSAPRGIDDDAKEALRERMLTRMQERTADEWMALYEDNGNVAAEPYGDSRDGLRQKDMVANGEIVTIEDPRLGPIRQLGAIARLTATPATIDRPAPAVGQHTTEVLAALDDAPRPPAPAPTTPTARPAHPLEGVTILEFATIIAAPLGASLLTDLGARVIKVEPIGGDPYRGMGEGFGAYVPTAKTTAGKESICLDLKSEAGSEIARRLVAQADILIHNYRPGVPERLGIGYEQVREYNPGIVHLAVMGYGPDGPGASRPSAHPIPGAVLGGALHQAGAGVPAASYDSLDDIREAGRRLFRANEANPDPNTSMAILSSALLGLYARHRTGEGQQIYVTMLAANAYANSDDFLDYEGKPPRTPIDVDLHGPHALYRLYPAREGWVCIAAPADHEWRALAHALADEDPAADDLATDPRFATTEARRANDADLATRLQTILQQRDAAAWERALAPQGIGCVEAGAEDFADFFRGDHALANGFAPEVDHAMWGAYRRWGPTVTLAEAPPRFGPGVLAGQHTNALLTELGMDDTAIARLHAEGVVSAEPTTYLHP